MAAAAERVAVAIGVVTRYVVTVQMAVSEPRPPFLYGSRHRAAPLARRQASAKAGRSREDARRCRSPFAFTPIPLNTFLINSFLVLYAQFPGGFSKVGAIRTRNTRKQAKKKCPIKYMKNTITCHCKQ